MSHQKVISFMAWLNGEFQCPHHPNWQVELRSGFPYDGGRQSCMDAIIGCSFMEEGNRCDWHLHFDDLRLLFPEAEVEP